MPTTSCCSSPRGNEFAVGDPARRLGHSSSAHADRLIHPGRGNRFGAESSVLTRRPAASRLRLHVAHHHGEEMARPAGRHVDIWWPTNAGSPAQCVGRGLRRLLAVPAAAAKAPADPRRWACSARSAPPPRPAGAPDESPAACGLSVARARLVLISHGPAVPRAPPPPWPLGRSSSSVTPSAVA